MSAAERFTAAAAALAIELVEATGADGNARVSAAMTRGARLKVSATIDAAGGALVALDLVDASGTEHRMAHVEGRPATRN